MPKTLLAVDDSATMRKVLEITFGGEDFRVLLADGSQRALAQLSEEPVAVVIDTSLEGDDPYALVREVRSRDARVAIVLLASRYNPYDAARGKSAGVDDSIDKPFDTQALIDKVKKAILARESPEPAAAAFAPIELQPPPAAQAPAVIAPFASAPRPPAGPGARLALTPQRSHTLSFEGGPAAPYPPPPAALPAMAPPIVHPPIARTAPSGVPVIQQPSVARPPPVPAPTSQTPTRASPAAAAHVPAPHGPAASAAAASVNGHLAGKLGDLGLTPAQVDAVLSLSREVVERVVWEVVPQLAEAIIKEELVRLTKD